MTTRQSLRILAICLATYMVCMWLCGCAAWRSDEQTNAHTVKTYHEEGTQGGVPYMKSGQEETSTDGTIARTSGPDPALMQALMTGVQTAATGGGFGALTTAGFSIGSAALAAWLNARKSAQQHKADADEAWSKLADATAPQPPAATK